MKTRPPAEFPFGPSTNRFDAVFVKGLVALQNGKLPVIGAADRRQVYLEAGDQAKPRDHQHCPHYAPKACWMRPKADQPEVVD